MSTASSASTLATPPDRSRRAWAVRALPLPALCCWLLLGALLFFLREAAVRATAQDMEQQLDAQLTALAAAIPQQLPPGKIDALPADLRLPFARSPVALRAALLGADGEIRILPNGDGAPAQLSDSLVRSLLAQSLIANPEKGQSCETPASSRQPLPDASLSLCRRTLPLLGADLFVIGVFPQPYIFSRQAATHQALLLLGWAGVGFSLIALAASLRASRNRARTLQEEWTRIVREERERNREHAAVHAALQEGFAVLKGTTVAYCNPGFAYGVGLEPDMPLGMDCAAFIHPEDMPEFERSLRRLRESRENPPHFLLRLVTKPGDLRWTSCALSHGLWQGEEVALLCTLDMTPLKNAQFGRSLAEANVRALMDTAPFGIAVFDAFGALSGANAVWNAMWGDPAQGGARRLTLADEHAAFPEAVAKALLSALDGESVTLENLESRDAATDETRWFTIRCAPLRDADGKPLGALMLQEDATREMQQAHSRQKLAAQAEQARYDLLRLHDHITALTDATPSVLIGVNKDRRITFWNSMAERRFDLPRSRAAGRAFGSVDRSLARHEPLVLKALHERRFLRISKVPYTENGATRYEDLAVYPVETTLETWAVVRIDDVTRRMEVEEDLARADRLASVGMLAAGMAHEVKNPLSGILLGTHTLKRRLLTDLPANHAAAEKCAASFDAVRRYMQERGIPALLESMHNSGQRIDAVVSTMMRFGHKHDLTRLPADVNSLVEKAVEFAVAEREQRGAGDFSRITVRRAPAPDLPPVLCAAVDIVQALLQLLRACAYSLRSGADAEEAVIDVRTRRDGNFAVITVADNGPGLEQEACRRVFEPFYVPNAPERGLFTTGLSLAFFVITSVHNGSLHCESILNKGTTFTVRLPLAGLRYEAGAENSSALSVP